jgi:hypothetical protein
VAGAEAGQEEALGIALGAGDALGQRLTPNAQRPTPNAQRPAPSAQRPAPSAERRAARHGTPTMPSPWQSSRKRARDFLHTLKSACRPQVPRRTSGSASHSAVTRTSSAGTSRGGGLAGMVVAPASSRHAGVRPDATLPCRVEQNGASLHRPRASPS